MKKLLVLLFFVPLLLPAQSSEVFAPFVSRLKSRAEPSNITLTWRNSKDLQGEKLIYRHTREIDEVNLDQAEHIATVERGLESYIDYPLDRQKYFYAVLIRDAQAKLYTLFVPFRNKTTIGRQITQLAPEKTLAAVITGITAVEEDDAIVISFSSTKTDRELLLFRNDAPIRNAEDLLSASSPVALDSGIVQYRDFPIPGVDYYYAAIDAGMFMIGKAELTLGVNTTEKAVQLPIGTGRVGLPEISPALRPLPLPFLMITTGVERGDDLSPSAALPEKIELRPATAQAIDQLLEGTPELKLQSMQIQILDEDRNPAGISQAYPLYTILQNQLLKSNYTQGERLLKNFLSIRHTPAIEARGRFYLAQVYYFLGKYRLAFMELLLAQEALYQPVQLWLDACYRQLEDKPLPL